MEIVRNFPALSIVMCMVGAILSSVLPKKFTRILNLLVITGVMVLSGFVFFYTLSNGSFVYTMGRFPAPWGNEIRAGVLEGMMAFFFGLIMFLSILGGRRHFDIDVKKSRQNLYFIMTNLLLSSLLAMVYTNDLFTAYVFVEINTISACGLIMVVQNGRTIEAAIRYMVMSLLGSGLFLIGICILYDITGNLLMTPVQNKIAEIAADPARTYMVPLVVAIALLCSGLAIKSALYPFHSWLPDAYGYSTVSSSAMLSSLVSKGYIFLLIKIIYRVVGFEIFKDSKIINILFIFGLIGMIAGSVKAIQEKDIMRMIAYSSVAQIGYIYMGFGLGSEAGMVASVFHIFSHAATKSLCFIAAMGLRDASDGSKKLTELTGAGYRNVLAGAAFTVAAFSMVGIPAFAGFISKILFAQAAVGEPVKMLPTVICLAISTILNAAYFMKTVLRLYSKSDAEYEKVNELKHPVYALCLVGFVALNVALGIFAVPVVEWITMGLGMFS